MPDWQPWRLVLYLSLELDSTSSTHFSRTSLCSHFERHMVAYHHEMMVLSVRATENLFSAWDTSEVRQVASGSSWGSPRGTHHENNCAPRELWVIWCAKLCLLLSFLASQVSSKVSYDLWKCCLMGCELYSGDVWREQTPCFLIKAINADLLEKTLELLFCHQNKN